MKRSRPYRPYLLIMLAAIVLAAVQPALPPFGRVFMAELMVWSVYAMSYDLLLGYTGMLSFGHAMFFGIGALGIAWGFKFLNLSPALTFLLALGLSVLTAMLSGFLVVRVRGHFFVIMTVILGTILADLALSERRLTGGEEGLYIDLPMVSVGGLQFSLYDQTLNYYMALVLMIFTYAVLRKLTGSSLGVLFRAVKENDLRTQFLGYRIQQIKWVSFVVGGAFAGLSGAMYAIVTRYAGAPLLDIVVSSNAVIYTLLGGSGTLLGPIIGAWIVIPAITYISGFFEQYMIIVGAMMIAIVLAYDRGILGLIQKMLGLAVD